MMELHHFYFGTSEYNLIALFVGKILIKEVKVSLIIKLNIHLELQISYRWFNDAPN